MIYLIHKGFVHIVEVPPEELKDSYSAYDYARAKVGAKQEDITPWGAVNFHDGVAKLGWRIGQ